MIHLAPQNVISANLVRPSSSVAAKIICRVVSNLELQGPAIFDKCSGCSSLRKMSSIPHGVYAATKVHMNMKRNNELLTSQDTTFLEHKNNSRERATSWPSFPKLSQQFMDHPLAKYNSKLMNSIWGLYNRYSVHNFKRVTEDEVMGRAGCDWISPNSFVLSNKAQQANQPGSAASGGGTASALPTASVPIRDPNPLNTLWIGGHAH